MNTFLDFLSDNTFFAIFSGVIIVLVLAFIVTLVKGKKSEQKPIEDVSEENYFNEQITTDNYANNINNESYTTNEFEANMMGSNSPDTGYQAAFTNYVPDLNEETSVNMEIPQITSNVLEEVSYSEPVFPDVQEMTETPAIEEAVPEIQEVKNPEVSNDIVIPSVNEEKEVVDNIFPDFVNKEETVSVEPIDASSSDDDIELPLPITESPELAFAAIPSEDTSINEDIKFESDADYDIEKTEIFDFPDFSKTEIDSEKALVDIEKVVLEAANKYIESVMKS